MTSLRQIMTGIFAVIGMWSAIKTIEPDFVTYMNIFQNWVTYSGWIVATIIGMVLIYREGQQKQELSEKADLLEERGNDKVFLKQEMSKTTTTLNYLSGNGQMLQQQAIPRTNTTKEAVQDEF